jgi:hypothetical protein
MRRSSSTHHRAATSVEQWGMEAVLPSRCADAVLLRQSETVRVIETHLHFLRQPSCYCLVDKRVRCLLLLLLNRCLNGLHGVGLVPQNPSMDQSCDPKHGSKLQASCGRRYVLWQAQELPSAHQCVALTSPGLVQTSTACKCTLQAASPNTEGMFASCCLDKSCLWQDGMYACTCSCLTFLHAVHCLLRRANLRQVMTHSKNGLSKKRL